MLSGRKHGQAISRGAEHRSCRYFIPQCQVRFPGGPTSKGRVEGLVT